MTCKVQNVASTRHYLDVSNRNYGGHAKVYFMSSLEGDDAISRRKIDSKVITEEPTVNRFMDPIEMEWQRNPEAAQKPSESSKTNEGEKSEPKNDKTEDKKPKKEDEKLRSLSSLTDGNVTTRTVKLVGIEREALCTYRYEHVWIKNWLFIYTVRADDMNEIYGFDLEKMEWKRTKIQLGGTLDRMSASDEHELVVIRILLVY